MSGRYHRSSDRQACTVSRSVCTVGMQTHRAILLMVHTYDMMIASVPPSPRPTGLLSSPVFCVSTGLLRPRVQSVPRLPIRALLVCWVRQGYDIMKPASIIHDKIRYPRSIESYISWNHYSIYGKSDAQVPTRTIFANINNITTITTSNNPTLTYKNTSEESPVSNYLTMWSSRSTDPNQSGLKSSVLVLGWLASYSRSVAAVVSIVKSQ